ncbi:MAG: hypothetical protein OXC31_24005 [Spirochaetaceae bacterium]|nr:hypothetical protein [Spirochaetaceae bacterium]
MDEPRESIWSVPSSLKTIYYAMFTVFALLSTALALVDVLSPGSPGSIVDRVLRFGERLAPMAVASAALSMLAMEVVGMVGIVGSYLQRRLDDHFAKRAKRLYVKAVTKGLEKGLAQGLEKGLEKGLAQGLAKGRAEERAKWEERERRIAESGARIPPPPPADEDAGT